jgi:hypothetical protein
VVNPHRFYVTHLVGLAATGVGTGQSSVWIHQLTKRHSQAPFKNVKGTIQKVLFHPTKPHFFVAVCVTCPYLNVTCPGSQHLISERRIVGWVAIRPFYGTGSIFLYRPSAT